MDELAQMIDAVRAHPWLLVGFAVTLVLVYLLLQRRPRIQRDADARLSALRREKTDQYTKLRPPR
jgi:hypothetical protein